MKDSLKEPLRLLDDPATPNHLAAAIRAEAEDQLSDADLARVAAAIGLSGVGLASAASASAAAAVPAAGGSAVLTWIGIGAMSLAVFGGGGLAWYAFGASNDRSEAAPTSPTIEATTTVGTTSVEATNPAPAEPSVQIAEAVVEPAPLVEDAPIEAPVPRARRVPARVPATVPAPPVEPPAPTESVEEPPPPPVDDDRAEALLVQRAEAALRSNPGQALQLANEHRRRFPAGVMTEEGEVVAIDALLQLGRRSEGEARAVVFERSHPHSIHLRRVRRLLEAEE